VVKMVTELKDYITEGQCCLVRLFVDKRTECKDINKETFPVYGGKCLSRRVVHC
jgi:hypothetical protein